MKNQDILNTINEMKYLFGYQRGKVISEQEQPNDFVVGGSTEVSVGPTTTSATTASSSTTTKTTRKATGLEVQKLLNTKYSLGLKEDGVIGPLTRGAIMTALEGGTASSAGSSSTTSSTTVAGSTTSTTTLPLTAGGTQGGSIDTSVGGGDASGLV